MAPPTQNSSDNLEGLSRCLSALNSGAVAEAERLCVALLEAAPSDPAVLQMMAAIRLAAEDAPGAERYANESLALRPDHVPTLILAGHAAQRSGELELAAYRWSRASELDPKRAEPAFRACAALITRGGVDVGPVLADLRKRFPDHRAGWLDIGEALANTKRYDAALACYALCKNHTPEAVYNIRRGDALYHLGRLAEAVEAFALVVEAEPDHFPAWFKLGLALQDSRDWAAAEEAYRRVLSLRPESAEAETNLGIVLQEAGDLTQAKQAYGRAVSLDPSSFGRIAQALSAAPTGEVWSDLSALKAYLLEEGRRSRERPAR